MNKLKQGVDKHPKRNITNPQDPKQDLEIWEVILEVEQEVIEGALQGTQGLNLCLCSEAPSDTYHNDESIFATRRERVDFSPNHTLLQK